MEVDGVIIVEEETNTENTKGERTKENRSLIKRKRLSKEIGVECVAGSIFLFFPGNIGNLKEVTERGGGGGEREKKRQIKKK